MNKTGGDFLGVESRIREVRKHFKLTQAEFGESLGVNRTIIKNYELAIVEPTTIFLDHLCLKYNIDPVWLNTGDGEMFHKVTVDEEIASFVGETLSENGDPFMKRILFALSRLDDNGIKEFKRFYDLMSSFEDKKEAEK